MWDRLPSADMDLAKQSLGARRAETSARHAEEVKSLEAKQAEEIHSLNAKQAGIELMNKLVNDFKQEFMNELARSSEPTTTDEAAPPETAVQTDEPGESGMPGSEKEPTTSSLGRNTEPTPAPAQIQVLFPSANFGRIRKIGS